MGRALGKSLRASIVGFTTFEALRDLQTVMFSLVTQLRASFAVRAEELRGGAGIGNAQPVLPLFYAAHSDAVPGREEPAVPIIPEARVDASSAYVATGGYVPWIVNPDGSPSFPAACTAYPTYHGLDYSEMYAAFGVLNPECTVYAAGLAPLPVSEPPTFHVPLLDTTQSENQGRRSEPKVLSATASEWVPSGVANCVPAVVPPSDFPVLPTRTIDSSETAHVALRPTSRTTSAWAQRRRVVDLPGDVTGAAPSATAVAESSRAVGGERSVLSTSCARADALQEHIPPAPVAVSVAGAARIPWHKKLHKP